MKRYTILFALSFVLSIGTLFAQFPELMNYQGVARDAGGNALAGQAISLRISIVSGSPTGNVEYQETHSVTTNNYGLFNIQIGSGTPTSGQFALIDWGAASHYASIEMDPAGGSTYQTLGTNQLVASPYAMHAKTVDNADDADADPTNEIQIVSKSGSTVTLSGGGGTFTDDVDDADADATNEIQIISKSGSTVTLSGGGGSYTDDVDDADADATNEIQILSISGSTVTLSGGGGSFSIDDTDASVTNELQTISKSGSTVTLSNSGGSFTDDVNDADASASNEIQALSISGNTISLSVGGGSVTLPPAGDTDWIGTTSLYNTGATVVGIGSSSPLSNAKLAIYPGNQTYGIYMDHNRTTAGTTYGFNFDLDNTYTGSATTYGGRVDGYKNGGGGTVYGLYVAGRNYNSSGTSSGTYGLYAYGYRSSTVPASTTYALYALQSGSAATEWAGYFSGNVYTTGTYSSSDRKLKKGIKPFTGALSTLLQLGTYTYEYDNETYKFMNLPKGPQIGLIAQDVAQLYPHLTTEVVQPAQIMPVEDAEDWVGAGNFTIDEDGMARVGHEVKFEGVNYAGFVPVLVESIKEQQQTINDLTEKLEAMEARLKALENK